MRYALLLLLLSSPLAAGEPQQTIPEDDSPLPVAVVSGPTSGVPGEILILDAGQSVRAEFFHWDVKQVAGEHVVNEAAVEQSLQVLKNAGYEGPFNAKPKPTNHLISEDGRTVQVASYPGAEYDVVLAVSNLDGIDLQRWTVRVADCPPKVPPDDDPPPPPGDYDFSDDVADWLSGVPESARSGMPDLTKLCKGFGDDGLLKNREYLDAKFEIGAALALGNTAADIAAWQPFFEKLSKAFGDIPDSVDLDEYRAAYVSVGRGLEAAL